MKTISLRRHFALLLVLWISAVALSGETPPSQPYTFLRKELAFTTTELGALEKGQIIVRLPKTAETREVAAFAIMRLDVPSDFFIEKVRDIVSFKKSDNVLQIGKFSNPPRLEDLAQLTLDPDEVETIKRCRLNKCALKMSAEFIERFRKEIDWSAADYRDRATALTREMLLNYVQLYSQGGNLALSEYRDKSYAVRPSEEFGTLLQAAPYMYDYAPELQKYLHEFPKNRPPETEDFFYWSKEKFGLKPVVSVTHVTIYKRPRPTGSDVLIASKGIYANHYLEASLGLTGFVQSQASEPSRSYLIYINRSRSDALRGLLAGLKRSMISGSLRDGAKKNMELIKHKLESDFSRSSSPPVSTR